MIEEDFADLYAALREPVLAFAVRRVGREAAKDVVSETFEVAWRKRAEFPDDRTKWAAWIVGIAKNKVLQELERRSRKHHDNRFTEDWLGPHPASTGEDVARVVVDSDAGRRVYRALSPAEKLLFDVAFFRELSPQDGAQVLGISTSAFTSRVNRLRQRLRELQELDPPDNASTSGGATR
ncbi:hypothetical protein ASD11_15010 [Aeromicrobium sp. Root495]|uniref:RNA polymerase sigma factor n=1 Tax=Aeromicrobium sp. Root495 TaxID=1736550 RepID=UPI0006FFA475|nr:RNA polymerase sigma factor [Aeromicrobium sp. Root495]KQY55811.1 hypothetical protein ASD11_15010 [Aeromicrobium sp. Root495]